jgi:hypothetical protein
VSHTVLGCTIKLPRTSSRYLQAPLRTGYQAAPYFILSIPKTAEDLAFGREYLRAGCHEGICEEVTTGEAERIRSTGAMISSRFVVWQDGQEERKGCVVVNLSKQSKHWPKGQVRMETLPEYALELERGEKLVSFDIQARYRHFRLAPRSCASGIMDHLRF